MIALLALAIASCQGEAKPRVPDKALFDELIRKTNAMKAFVAEYRVHVPGDEHEKSIRIVYRAPGEMRIDLADWMFFEMRDGMFDVAGAPPGGSAMTAHVPIGDFESESRTRLDEIIHAELPSIAKDWEASLDCGVALALDVSSSSKDEKEDFQFHVGYDCRRTALLSWLESWRAREDVRYDGDDHLTISTARGARLTLSTRTGFVERIEKEVHGEQFRFELASLDLDPHIDAKAFEVPSPPKDAKDASKPFTSKLQESMLHAHRAAIFEWTARHVGDASLPWDADAREHVRKILARLDEDAFAALNGDEIAASRKAIEQLGSTAREQYKNLGPSDAAARGSLDEKYDTQRKTIVDHFETLSRSLYSDMTISERTVPDTALRASLQEIDQRAFQESFDRVMQNPLMEAFDDAISRAKAGG